MVKIGKETLMFTLLGLLSVIILLALFVKVSVSHVIYAVFACILPLFLYINEDVKLDKKGAKGLFALFAAFLCAGIGQFVFSFSIRSIAWLGGAFMYFAFIFMFIREIKSGPHGEDGEFKIGRFKETLIVAGIFLVALFLRYYKLADIPLGIWFDEAQNGTEVLNLMEKTSPQVFIPDTIQMPTLYFYLSGLFFNIFGIDVMSMKYLSALLGALTPVAFYFMLRAVFRDVTTAAAGALMLASLRWHLNFSRVAFLGISTIFLQTVAFYFYLKMVEKKSFAMAALAGLVAGIAMYSFSAANFIPVIIAIHAFFIFVSGPKVFIKDYFGKYVVVLLVFLAVSAPLLQYAARNLDSFTQRAKDVSIMREIEDKGNLSPVLNSIKIYSLMFNLEGDYNGRHNLYKKAMLDDVTAALFVIGFSLSLLRRRYNFFAIWFLAMLLNGILTVTIEAPQAYRVSCVTVPIIFFVTAALSEAKETLLKINKKRWAALVLVLTATGAMVYLNIVQYFVIYPKEISSFMDFSPESTGITRFINANSNDYRILVSRAAYEKNGFLGTEQQVILRFTTYGKGKFEYMEDLNKVSKMDLYGKKGVALVVRDTDEGYIEAIHKYYPKAREETVMNNFRGNIIYHIFFINAEDVVEGKACILYK